MNITYDTIRGSRIVTAKDQGALILRTGTVYDGIGREASHDLDLLRHASSRIGIMYRGKLLEQGETEAVLNAPTHPYTRELIENFSYMRD